MTWMVGVTDVNPLVPVLIMLPEQLVGMVVRHQYLPQAQRIVVVADMQVGGIAGEVLALSPASYGTVQTAAAVARRDDDRLAQHDTGRFEDEAAQVAQVLYRTGVGHIVDVEVFRHGGMDEFGQHEMVRKELVDVYFLFFHNDKKRRKVPPT